MFLPFGIIYFLGELNFIPLNTINLLISSAVVLVADIALFFVSKSTFRREETLTKWKTEKPLGIPKILIRCLAAALR
jgi:uncharacterized membrane protein YbhN (UPF0104 family)